MKINFVDVVSEKLQFDYLAEQCKSVAKEMTERGQSVR